MSDNSQSSSAHAMANSAAGAVREGVAKVTGNPHDAAAAEDKKGTLTKKNWKMTYNRLCTI